MAYLQALSSNKHSRLIDILEPKFVMGRSSDCNLWEIFERNDTVSHHHARIEKVGNQFVLIDTDSHNGTRLNNQLVKPRKPTVLQDGDVIAICKWKFRFLAASPKGMENGDTKGVPVPYGDSSVESRINVDSDGSSSSHNTTSAAIRLKAILGVLTALGQTLDLEDLLTGLLREVLQVFPAADTCQVCLLSHHGDSLDTDTVAVIHRDPSNEPSHLSKTILAEVLRTKQAILFSDRHINPIFQESETVREKGLRSAMCVPLMAEEEVIGVMQVDTHRQRERFRKDDLEVLTSIAPLINLAIRHSQLHERLVAQRAIEYEMAAAQRMQLSLLPRQTPAIAGYDLFAHYHAALQVGGDYYDYISLPDGRIAVVLADASGKGTSAALYMSAVSGELKCSLLVEKSTSAALGRLNRWICDNPESRFVTMAVVVLDPATHQATILNAGHFAPVLRRANGAIEEIGEPQKGFPLGVQRDMVYQEITIPLAPGESLLMYTDGFTDALNSKEQPYSQQQLFAQVQTAAPNLSDLGRQIVDHVRAFMGVQPQYDDMCMNCLGRWPEAP